MQVSVLHRLKVRKSLFTFQSFLEHHKRPISDSLLNRPTATKIIQSQHSPSRPQPEDQTCNMDTLNAAEAAYLRQVQLETQMMADSEADFYEMSNIAYSHGHHLGEARDKCDKEEDDTDDASGLGEDKGHKYKADGVDHDSHGIEGGHERTTTSPSSNDSHAIESGGQRAKSVNENKINETTAGSKRQNQEDSYSNFLGLNEVDLVRRAGCICECCKHLQSLDNRLANRDDLVKFLDCPATYALNLEELKELMVTFNLAEAGTDGAAPGRITNQSELIKATHLIQDGLEALNYAKNLVNFQTVQQAERELGHGKGNMVGPNERKLQRADVIASSLQAFGVEVERLKDTAIATRVADHPTLLKGK